MQLKPSETWQTIVFYGALWGIAEATLGYLFHGLSRLLFIPGLAGFIMFPLALFFMHRAYLRTGQVSTLMGVSAIAAAIKLTNLALPVLPPMDTINPAMAILLEGAAVTVLFGIARQFEEAVTWPRILLVATGWKAMFLFIQLAAGIESGMAFADPMLVLRFLLLDSIVNTVLIVLYLRLAERRQRDSAPVRIVPASVVTALAVVVNIGIALARHGAY